MIGPTADSKAILKQRAKHRAVVARGLVVSVYCVQMTRIAMKQTQNANRIKLP